MVVIAAFALILTVGGLLLIRRFGVAGRSRAAGTFMVTSRALLYYLGVVSTIVGIFFCILAVSLAFG